MKFSSVLIFVALIAAAPSYILERGMNAISREEAAKHVRYLSSDALEGRRTGSEGNNAAAEYIRSEALALGVRPLPGQDDLFQPLEYIKVTPVPGESKIKLTDSLGNAIGSSDIITLLPPAKNVSLSGEVAFAGYGYMNSEEKYNDFAGITVNDRIVIIMTRSPDLHGSGMPSSGEPVSEMIEAHKLPMIMLQKAKAVFFVADPALGSDISSDLISMGSSYQLIPLFMKQFFTLNLNAYAISTQTADLLLGRTGLTLKHIQDSIASSKKPASFIIPDLRAEVTVNVKEDTVTSNNIVGYFEGSDPELKKECVIYTAHYDHIGKDAAGNIYNGANDNASGSVGLLTVAKAFSSLDKKPLRSIVFLWTTGEEEGLHGSTYYTDNPLFPLKKTVADINFDMIGRSRRETDVGASLNGDLDITGHDTIKIISSGENPGLVRIAKAACRKTDLYPIDEGKGLHFSGSDHYPFYRKGIPVLFFFTGLHSDYHKQTDDFEFIDLDKLIKVSMAGFITGYKLADAPGEPFID
jgi:hypothetical protein